MQFSDDQILLVMLPSSVVKFLLAPFGRIHPKSKLVECAWLASVRH
jgi:hypothetical protein